MKETAQQEQSNEEMASAENKIPSTEITEGTTKPTKTVAVKSTRPEKADPTKPQSTKTS